MGVGSCSSDSDLKQQAVISPLGEEWRQWGCQTKGRLGGRGVEGLLLRLVKLQPASLAQNPYGDSFWPMSKPYTVIMLKPEMPISLAPTLLTAVACSVLVFMPSQHFLFTAQG